MDSKGKEWSKHAHISSAAWIQVRRQLCTDVVARGLDIPEADWSVWFYPFHDPKKIIQPEDRMARGLNGRGTHCSPCTLMTWVSVFTRRNPRFHWVNLTFSCQNVLTLGFHWESCHKRTTFSYVSTGITHIFYTLMWSHSPKQIFDAKNLNLNIKRDGGGSGFCYQKTKWRGPRSLAHQQEYSRPQSGLMKAIAFTRTNFALATTHLK